ncbi:Hypothetical predicted protein [Paramuricea clavata]|uniref:Uncharacterized protein n=1 Tax=Paramuricea clavata TaxID=317549 RepID=A0A7D9E0F2_PARCT|nr:Hypothetical predicted protein [Paramuricea clavata]
MCHNRRRYNMYTIALLTCESLTKIPYFMILKGLKQVQENCSRVDECLRIHCAKVAKQLIGKRGGSRQNLLAKAKSVAIRHSELSTVTLVNDLQSQVSQLQNVNAAITNENKILSVKCKEASTQVGQIQKKIDKATVDIDKLKTENNKLYNVIEKISPQRRFEDKGKTFVEVGKRQQERKLQTLATRVEQALWFSESFGLRLDRVKLVDDSGQAHSLSFSSEKRLKSYKELPGDEQQDIQQVLFIIYYEFCIGEAAYHKLTCCLGGEELPRSYLVKQCKDNLNKLCYIERTPGEADGAALNFHDELSTVIEKMIESDEKLRDTVIKVKISGDGAKMTRLTNFIISFSILNAEDTVMSSKGNHTVAVIKGHEDYDLLKRSCSKIFDDINKLGRAGQIKIKDKNVPIEIFVGGDYKVIFAS